MSITIKSLTYLAILEIVFASNLIIRDDDGAVIFGQTGQVGLSSTGSAIVVSTAADMDFSVGALQVASKLTVAGHDQRSLHYIPSCIPDRSSSSWSS
jgi:hypothetical protein